jgi:hypothetical protein
MPAGRPLPQVGLGGNVRHGTSFEEIQVLSNHIQAAVAAERRRDLLAEAEADRQIRRARWQRPRPDLHTVRQRPVRRLAGWLLSGLWPAMGNAARGRPAVLRDGSPEAAHAYRGSRSRGYETP